MGRKTTSVINVRGLKAELGKKAGPVLRPHIQAKGERAVHEAKDQLIEQFLSHLITQEIEAGPHASNKSDTLGGYGNLFTYIGFEEGSDPIAPIKRYLEKAIHIKRITRQELVFFVSIDLPDKEDLARLSPVPWAPGRSWVDAMEHGLSGLGQYLVGESGVSRSGNAVQATVNLRGGRFHNQPYMSPMLNALRTNIRMALRQ